jgi:hypothetical protein
VKTFVPRHSKKFLENPMTPTAKTDETNQGGSNVSFGSDPLGVFQKNNYDEANKTPSSQASNLFSEYPETLLTKLTKPIRTDIQSLSILNAERTESLETTCPNHWLHIPLLPSRVTTMDSEQKGKRYRVNLFTRWYIIRFCPNISNEHVEVTGDDKKHRAFANLDEFYRWAWAENYFGEIKEAN